MKCESAITENEGDQARLKIWVSILRYEVEFTPLMCKEQCHLTHHHSPYLAEHMDQLKAVNHFKRPITIRKDPAHISA